MYVADTGNNRIRRITPDGAINTFAGNGNASFYGDGLFGFQASIHAGKPQGLATAPDGTLYVADTMNHRVRRITPGDIIQTVAGNGVAGFNSDGMIATQASLNQPVAVKRSTVPELHLPYRRYGQQLGARGFSAGQHHNSGRQWGQRRRGGDGDGRPATRAQLASPHGVAVDSAQNLYIAEAAGGRVRVVTGGTISTLCRHGASLPYRRWRPSPGCLAQFTLEPVVDTSGDVFFTDFASDAVRAVTPAPATPAIAGVVNGASNQVAPLAPAEVVVIYGSGLGPPQLGTGGELVDSRVGGVTVLFNGVPGQMLYAFSGQVSAVNCAPWPERHRRASCVDARRTRVAAGRPAAGRRFTGAVHAERFGQRAGSRHQCRRLVERSCKPGGRKQQSHVGGHGFGWPSGDRDDRESECDAGFEQCCGARRDGCHGARPCRLGIGIGAGDGAGSRNFEPWRRDGNGEIRRGCLSLFLDPFDQNSSLHMVVISRAGRCERVGL